MIIGSYIRVLYGDTDAMGQAYYGNYLKWFEVGRAEWFRARGSSYREVEEKGVYLPVLEAHCSYKRPAFYDDILTIDTTFQFENYIKLKFSYEITRNDELIATGYTVHVCVTQDRKVLKPPEYLKELLESAPRPKQAGGGADHGAGQREEKKEKEKMAEKMIIFPAIDLKDGLCVRLMQGDPDKVTVYGHDPVMVARRWEEEGARWLHVIDLDGAFSKEPRNREVIASIVKSVSMSVQVGGGIRRMETIDEYLAMGVERVILGTVALRQPELMEEACGRYPGRVALGIDARDGQVAIEGWKETTTTDAATLVKQFDGLDLAAVIYTDIHRDGMQTGVNVEATKRLMEDTGRPVIASGGVATLADIEALLPLAPLGLAGVITGRAIYNGTLKLGEALALAEGRHGASR